MGVKRSLQTGGNLLNLVTTILTILSTATNYWIRQQGGHSGLWQECTDGICSNIPCQNTLAVTAACMVLSATFSFLSLGMGMRIQCQEGESLRSQNTIALLFLSGFLVRTRDEGFCLVILYVPCFVLFGFSLLEACSFLKRNRGKEVWLLLLIALIGYTVKNAWKPDVFFSWSYFFGWLALPFSFLAGFCFLLADMIVQSTEAISGFPVCL